jgi:hypothetical protein
MIKTVCHMRPGFFITEWNAATSCCSPLPLLPGFNMIYFIETDIMIVQESDSRSRTP